MYGHAVLELLTNWGQFVDIVVQLSQLGNKASSYVHRAFTAVARLWFTA